MTRIVVLILLATTIATTVASAAPLPVPNRGGSCPFGYQASGSYCVPSAGASDAIPKPLNGGCPFGWLASGSACCAAESNRIFILAAVDSRGRRFGRFPYVR